MESWKTLILEHDSASNKIRDFFELIWSYGIKEAKIYGSDTPDRKESITKKIQGGIGELDGKILTLYGDGHYHHYTYGLCNTIAKKRSNNYLYIHADNHTDAAKREDHHLGCGSFTENILEEPNAKDIIFLGTQHGVNNYNRTHVSQEILCSRNAEKNLKEVLRKKPQKDVYLSMDLDVLRSTEFLTSFNQGELMLEDLVRAVEVIQFEKNLISADILGYSNWSWSGCICPVSMLTYATLAAKITGKDAKELYKLRKYFMKKRREGCDTHILENDFKKITKQLKV